MKKRWRDGDEDEDKKFCSSRREAKKKLTSDFIAHSRLVVEESLSRLLPEYNCEKFVVSRSNLMSGLAFLPIQNDVTTTTMAALARVFNRRLFCAARAE